MDIAKIVDVFKEQLVITKSGKDTFIGPYFFHYFKREEGILIRITEISEEEIILSDGHTTTDYLEERDIDLTLYSKQVEKILQRFKMVLDGGVLKMRCHYNDYRDIARYLGYFVQGITLIANIDL